MQCEDLAILLGAFVTSIATLKPNLTTPTKKVEDINGGSVRPVDKPRCTIVASNTGNDRAMRVTAGDPLPPRVTCVPVDDGIRGPLESVAEVSALGELGAPAESAHTNGNGVEPGSPSVVIVHD